MNRREVLGGSVRQRGRRWQVVIERERDEHVRRVQQVYSFGSREEALEFAGLDELDVEQEPEDGTRFPVGPLVVEAGSVAELARRVGVCRRTVIRAQDAGLTAWRADEWACALRLHPLEVWGAAWG